jgi:hypothetical protein
MSGYFDKATAQVRPPMPPPLSYATVSQRSWVVPTYAHQIATLNLLALMIRPGVTNGEWEAPELEQVFDRFGKFI